MVGADVKKQVSRSRCTIAEHTAAAFGASVQIDMEDLCPALINDKSLSGQMHALARELLGEEKAIELSEPSLGADDFAFFSNLVPGCYFYVGAHTEDLPGQLLHSPTMAPHETSIETALLLLLALIRSKL